MQNHTGYFFCLLLHLMQVVVNEIYTAITLCYLTLYIALKTLRNSGEHLVLEHKCSHWRHEYHLVFLLQSSTADVLLNILTYFHTFGSNVSWAASMSNLKNLARASLNNGFGFSSF